MFLPKHRRFIEYEVEPWCVSEVMLRLILLYAQPVSSEQLDVDGEEKVLCADEMYVNAVEAIAVGTTLYCKAFQKGFLSYRRSCHIFYTT